MKAQSVVEAIEGLCRTIAKVARYIMGIRIEAVAKIGCAMIVGGILVDILITHYGAPIEYARAAEVVSEVEAKDVMIEVLPTIPLILKAIALCESEDRHYEKDGVTVILGRLTRPELGQDVGRYQINTKYHLARAQELGLDLWDEADNEAYALRLYKEQGTAPWSASKHCWQKV